MGKPEVELEASLLDEIIVIAFARGSIKPDGPVVGKVEVGEVSEPVSVSPEVKGISDVDENPDADKPLLDESEVEEIPFDPISVTVGVNGLLDVEEDPGVKTPPVVKSELEDKSAELSVPVDVRGMSDAVNAPNVRGPFAAKPKFKDVSEVVPVSVADIGISDAVKNPDVRKASSDIDWTDPFDDKDTEELEARLLDVIGTEAPLVDRSDTLAHPVAMFS